jgi:glycosyltransferase involved in cell wall biosynthesis
MSRRLIAIVGTTGVPASYGGFETLAENLIHFHTREANAAGLTVWCSSEDNPPYGARYESARLRYIPLRANGIQSIPYDILSLCDAIRTRHQTILLLGVSGALFLPVVRLVSRAHIVTNIDGIEWKRGKWNWLARTILQASEWAAIRFSHEVIADNKAIADYVTETYGRPCSAIPYGGDHALEAEPDHAATFGLPDHYAFALCRIEPENNVAMILEAFSGLDMPLVFVGNWERSEYGRELKACYKDHQTITIHDPVYEPRGLRAIRDRASIYVHGHSAGGTNPSLVEMMHFGIPVLAHGCSFNRHSTEGKARYFQSATELSEQLRSLDAADAAQIGYHMRDIAQRKYTWDQIGKAYFELLDRA